MRVSGTLMTPRVAPDCCMSWSTSKDTRVPSALTRTERMSPRDSPVLPSNFLQPPMGFSSFFLDISHMRSMLFVVDAANLRLVPEPLVDKLMGKPSTSCENWMFRMKSPFTLAISILAPEAMAICTSSSNFIKTAAAIGEFSRLKALHSVTLRECPSISWTAACLLFQSSRKLPPKDMLRALNFSLTVVCAERSKWCSKTCVGEVCTAKYGGYTAVFNCASVSTTWDRSVLQWIKLSPGPQRTRSMAQSAAFTIGKTCQFSSDFGVPCIVEHLH
mmetsp:Transcript_67008/g.187316  ORF Transcript_67008/g.187316 Transcript_67008/m.187316 type:complete len:274 (-) Transcript_67008:1025-1846(-)